MNRPLNLETGSVINLLKNHRSIRRFTDQAIEPALLQNLIEAGQMASTSSFIQAVSVIEVSDPEIRTQFAELAGEQPYIKSAAAFLVFCADLNRNRARAREAGSAQPDYGWVEQFIAATVDTALFAQNVVVAAESEGLGCCYIGGIRNDPDRVTRLLALPELVFPVFGMCLGYPDQNPSKKPRLPLPVVLHQNRYQSAKELAKAIQEYDTNVKEYYRIRTGGKLDQSWSEQMAKQAASQKRPHIKKYAEKQGFMLK